MRSEARKWLDDYLEELKREKNYRRQHGINGEYPNDSRVAEEIMKPRQVAARCSNHYRDRAAYYRNLAEELESDAAYFEAMEFLFEREIQVALRVRR